MKAADRAALPQAKLTARDIQTLRYAARGMSYPQMAAELFISPNTCRDYLQRAMAKLGVSTRVQAVLKAERMGLLGGVEV